MKKLNVAPNIYGRGFLIHEEFPVKIYALTPYFSQTYQSLDAAVEEVSQCLGEHPYLKMHPSSATPYHHGIAFLEGSRNRLKKVDFYCFVPPASADSSHDSLWKSYSFTNRVLDVNGFTGTGLRLQILAMEEQLQAQVRNDWAPYFSSWASLDSGIVEKRIVRREIEKIPQQAA